MPVIARFYGMIIKMYLQGKEHGVAHFHVIYGECAGVIDVRTGKMLEGDLPSKAQSMIAEWTLLHQQALLKMWKPRSLHNFPHWSKEVTMFHKISNVKPLQDMLLFVEFQDGTELIYNVGILPAQNEIFNELKNPELFVQVKVDTGGYGISWNDDIDLDGEEIWANGTIVKDALQISPGCSCPTCGQKIRRRSEAQANASRANLAKRTHKGGRPINPNSKRQQMLAKKALA